MAKSIGTLKAALILDTNGWLGGFAKAGTATKGFAGGIGKSLAGVVSSYGAMATAAMTGALSVGSLAKSFNDVDRQAKLADRLGITVGEVQKLALAADLAGTDVELLAKSMLKMGKNIGSGGMTLDKRLFQVADGLSKIKDAGARGAKAEKIFGKGGQELINVLMQGGRGIRASADAIDKFGLALSRVDAAKIEAANDAWTTMKTVLGGLRNQLAVEMAPTVTGFIDTWLRGLEIIKNRHEALAKTIKDSGKETTTLYERMISLIAADAPWNRSGINAKLIQEGLIEQRKDAERDAMNAGRVGGAAALAKDRLGGKTGHEKLFSNPLERGTVEAGSAILKAGGSSPIDKVAENTRQANIILENLKRAQERQFRKDNAGNTLKPSNLGGP